VVGALIVWLTVGVLHSIQYANAAAELRQMGFEAGSPSSFTLGNFIASSLKTHLGEHAFAFAGPAFEHLLFGAAVLAVFWLILFWMFRRKIFLRI